MKMDRQAFRGHILVAVAVAAGIVGMEMVFSGVMDGDLPEVSRGVPLLLIGLWWAGRELGRSMRASRIRHSVDTSHEINVTAVTVDPRKGSARGNR